MILNLLADLAIVELTALFEKVGVRKVVFTQRYTWQNFGSRLLRLPKDAIMGEYYFNQSNKK